MKIRKVSKAIEKDVEVEEIPRYEIVIIKLSLLLAETNIL